MNRVLKQTQRVQINAAIGGCNSFLVKSPPQTSLYSLQHPWQRRWDDSCIITGICEHYSFSLSASSLSCTSNSCFHFTLPKALASFRIQLYLLFKRTTSIRCTKINLHGHKCTHSYGQFFSPSSRVGVEPQIQVQETFCPCGHKV